MPSIKCIDSSVDDLQQMRSQSISDSLIDIAQHSFHLLFFQYQMQGQQPLDYDTVAFALLNAFSKGDMEDQKDNSLGIFLAKLYKNNTSAKPKRMNSIRLSRFNAFLYRVNNSFPDEELACQVIHASMLAMLSNDRNFVEEDDQEIVISIAKWACQALENTVEKGYYEIAINSLRYLLRDSMFVKPTVPTAADFQEMVRECSYLSTIELNSEDEKKAYQEPINYNITSAFSLDEFILDNIHLNSFYRKLFKGTDKRQEVISMFGSHIKIAPPPESKSDLFIQTFLTDAKLIGQHLGLIIKTLEDHCLGITGLRSALQRLLDLGIDAREIMRLQLKGTKTQELFLEMLKERYCGSRITEIIEAFLAGPTCNMIAPCLLGNSDNSIPIDYLSLLFKEGDFTQRHVVLIAFTLIEHHSAKLHVKLQDLWQISSMSLDPERNFFVVKAFYFSLCECDKSTMLAKLIATLNLNSINGSPQSSTIPTGIIKPDKLTSEDKAIVTRILNESNISECALPLKIQLLGLCGENLQMTRRIKFLQNLFYLPVQQILKSVASDQVNKDPVLLAAVLMGINNRIEVTFIDEPDEKALHFLATYYKELDSTFGFKLGELLNQKTSSPISYYLWCLSRYNIQTGSSLGGFPEPLNLLLNGQKKYNRLVQTDFSGYFYKEESNRGLAGDLWTEKKIIMQIRRMLRKLLRKDKNLTEQLKDVYCTLGNQWSHVLAVKLIFAYFQAFINNPQILKHVLLKVVPEFSFFEKVYAICQNQNQEYIDFLTYLPNLLFSIYPEAIEFMSRLVDSQAVAKKQKDKRKSKKRKSHDRTQIAPAIQDSNPIFDIPSLFEFFKKTKSFNSLFGDPTNLGNFDQLFKIVAKMPQEDAACLKNLMEGWLEMICIFHPQKGEEQKWRIKVLSYCRVWRVIFLELGFQLKLQTLSRHFDILAQLLNMHYESKAESPDLEEQLLLTLLLILQAGQTGIVRESERVPLESIKNCLLGYRLPVPYEQQYFTCNTCSLSVCQVCAPFLHKHHDLTYTGKDGSCVHDSSQKKLPAAIPERPNNIFPGQSRSRREEDLFALNFDLGEEEMEYSQHIRFRELMQYRLHEQQRERERQAIMRQKMLRRQRSRSREREAFLKQKDQLLEEQLQVQPSIQEEVSNEIINEIKSQNSKSICNINVGFRPRSMFQPEFTPSEEESVPYVSQIDARPLRHILMNELQISMNTDNEQGKSKFEIVKERYNFFKQSTYFKTSRGDYGGLMRGSGIVAKRNLLTANKKFLAFPSASNGILLLSISVLTLKMQRRQSTKAMGDFQQERPYISNAINNSNLAFEPFQLLFGKNGLLAVVGVAQLGFFVLSQQGKVQRFVESDLKCAQPITKFQWIGKQRSNVFALCYGNTIRMGSVADDLRVRTGNRLKIQIDKIIKDFEIVLENNFMMVYILDADGGLYRGEFDYRETRSINISDKKVQDSNLGSLSAMILFNKKMLVSSQTGKLHLLKAEGKNTQMSLIQTYQLEQILRSSQSKLKGTYCISSSKIIQSNDNVTSIGCLLLKAGNQGKKKGAALAILRLSGTNNDLDVLIMSEEQTVEHFEVVELGENNLAIMAVQESGTVWVVPYTVPAQLLQQREDSKIPITEESVMAVNKVLKLQKLIKLTRSCELRRCDTYKDGKDITAAYNITVDHPFKITFRANNPYKYFITGFSFNIESNQSGQIETIVWSTERRNSYEKSREIQIGLTLKETLQTFVEDDDIVITYKMRSGNLSGKGIKIYGVDFNSQSIYRSAYAQLHRLVTIHFLYDDKNFIHYLQSPERNSLPRSNLTEFEKIKTNYKYSHKEFTLLLKLQLLRVSTCKGLKSQQLNEMFEFVRAELLPQSEKRQFLQKSCWRLLKQLCYLQVPEGRGRVGHPYEFRTALDLYYYQKSYSLWMSSRKLSSFQKIVNFLYGLIFKRISNLYLIMRLNPSLIYELTFYYKNALHSLKQAADQSEQMQLAKLISLCPSYVALVCEFYQTLKNTSGGQMIDEKESSPEKVVLDLLEEVFCATKKELYRQIFVSPEQYLDRLYLTKKHLIPIVNSVDIFGVQQQGQPSDHASRKASIGQQEAIQSEESQMELEDESQKQMLEEQAREMPDAPQPSIQPIEAKVQLQRQLPKGLKKLTNILSGYLLEKGKNITFIYYQFSFQMLTALFRLDSYLTKQNAVFYLGFAFNLLRIIEFNSEPSRDKEYINEFFKSVIEAISKPTHSILFLVLNYFFESTCTPKDQTGRRTLQGAKTKMSLSFYNYLIEFKIDVEQLLTSLKVKKTSASVTMSKAMKFVQFELENEAYQLKFLGNLYVLLRNYQHPQLITPSKKLKDFILGVVIRHKLRVFNNIMVSEQWTSDLEDAKIAVGFETIKDDAEQGINLLYECATKNRDVFVRKLASNNELITRLQDLLDQKGIKANPVLQMLSIYYDNE